MDNTEPGQEAFRPLITGANMYSLFVSLFTAKKSPACTGCRVPQPFWGPGAGTSEVYWYMPTPEPCRHGCDRVLAELWARISAQYRIVRPGKELASWSHGIRVATRKPVREASDCASVPLDVDRDLPKA